MDVTRPVDIAILSGVGQSLTYRSFPEVVVPTPFGATSTPVRLTDIGGQRIALIARRGDDDVLQPHLVPYRANIWALAKLGARVLISSTASSSLREAYPPGTFVLTDQIIDQTRGREETFFDHGDAVQLSSAPMFDRTLRNIGREAMEQQGVRVVDFGTTVVVNGPRFSSPAELRFYAAMGADVVNMTLLPETSLARELGLAVLNVTTITDRAGEAGEHGEATELEFIRRRSARSQDVLLRALNALVPAIPRDYRSTSNIPAHRIEEILAMQPLGADHVTPAP